jgi:3-deoxy-manno-octulosonate cytidylyltransferase (CMP-KDO synthetase)
MKSIIIIPARQDSTRFPGKPRAMIKDKTLLNRVWSIAKSVKNADDVCIATDDGDIFKHAEEFGAKAVMTSTDCPNGTERVYQAAQKLHKQAEDVIINLQGDAVLTPPWIIEAIIDEMKKDNKIGIATPATRLTLRQYRELSDAKASGAKSSGTMVVFDINRNALYFSKNMIPFVRPEGPAGKEENNLPLYRHIGLYAYRADFLQKYVELQPTPLEKAEKLEQLRALEHGMPIRVVIVDYRGRTHWSVDNPEDIAIVENIIEKEGELF